MHNYSVSGLAVSSDVALPGLIDQPRREQVDVRIVAGDVPETIDGAIEIGPNWRSAGDSFLIEVPGVVRMLLTGGRELRYAPARDVPREEAAIFISGTGFGILLHQRRRVVLHASAVRVGDSAVLFCGPSGAGKSTLAAALGERGYDLVTDDFCGVELRDGAPWIEPDARQHKLWQQAIDALDLAGRRADAVRSQLEKYYVEPRAAITVPLRVAALYQLRQATPPHGPGIQTPNIIDAALIVRRNAYRPRLVHPMGQRGLYFEIAAAFSRSAGVYFLSRMLRFDQMPVVIDQLEQHWTEQGLLARPS